MLSASVHIPESISSDGSVVFMFYEVSLEGHQFSCGLSSAFNIILGKDSKEIVH